MCRSDILPRGALFALVLLAGCTAPTVAPPPPPPPPPPVQARATAEGDAPLTAGGWHYQAGQDISYARFGKGGLAPDLVLRCDRSTRQVALLRSGDATEIVVTTSAGTERFPAGRIDLDGMAMSGAIFRAGDAFLDRFAFSRGRVSIAASGLPTLIAPAWAEPARAIEDCRK